MEPCGGAGARWSSGSRRAAGRPTPGGRRRAERGPQWAGQWASGTSLAQWGGRWRPRGYKKSEPGRSAQRPSWWSCEAGACTCAPGPTWGPAGPAAGKEDTVLDKPRGRRRQGRQATVGRKSFSQWASTKTGAACCLWSSQAVVAVAWVLVWLLLHSLQAQLCWKP